MVELLYLPELRGEVRMPVWAVAVSGGAVYSNEDRGTRRRRKKRVQGLKGRKNQEKILDHLKATSDKMGS